MLDHSYSDRNIITFVLYGLKLLYYLYIYD